MCPCGKSNRSAIKHYNQMFPQGQGKLSEAFRPFRRAPWKFTGFSVDASGKKRYDVSKSCFIWKGQLAMKKRENENRDLLHCRNCDGYYDPALPNCPHCGEETTNNLQSNSGDRISVTQYGGGFGAAGSALSRTAMLIVAVLLMVALAALIVMSFQSLSKLGSAIPANSSVVSQDPADASAPGDESADSSADTSAPPVEKPKKEDPPVVDSPESIALDYYDLTLQSGEAYQLVATITPKDWTGELTWSTDNKYIATVSADGTVTHTGGGTCTVTVSAGETTVTCIVRCKGAPAATSSEDAAQSVTGKYPIQKSTSDKAPATTDTPEEEEPKEPKEPEDEPEEPTEPEEPEDTPEEEPEEEPDEPEPTSESDITLQYYDITLNNVGDGYTFYPSGGNGTYTWSSANSSIASVSSDGQVVARSPGTTTVTCTSGSVSVNVIVRVK